MERNKSSIPSINNIFNRNPLLPTTLIIFVMSLVVLLLALYASKPTSMVDKAAELNINQTGEYYGILIAKAVDNYKNRKSVIKYYLQTDDGKIFATDLQLETRLKPGTRIRLKGRIINNTLQLDRKNNQLQQLQSSEILNQSPAAVTGGKKLAVIAFNFSDLKSDTPSLGTMHGLLNGTIRDFLLENSYSLFDLVAEVYGRYDLSISKTCDENIFEPAAIAAADSHINYNQYQYLMFIYPDSGCNAVATIENGPTYQTQDGAITLPYTDIPNVYFKKSIIAHELGHNFGAYESNSWECGAKADGGFCSSMENYDPWDPMGGGFIHYNTYHKSVFGWLPITNITLGTSGVYTINPSELQTNSTQIVKIKRTASTWYYLENRNKIGFDSGLNDSAVAGVIIYIVPPIISSGDSHLVDSHPQEGDLDVPDSGLEVAETLRLDRGKISVQVKSKTPGGPVSVKLIPDSSVTPTKTPTPTKKPRKTPTPTPCNSRIYPCPLR